MDLRTTWMLDWPDLRELLLTRVREHERGLLIGRWPYQAQILDVKRQTARILLCRHMGLDYFRPNRHPLDIFIGALVEYAYELGAERVPDGYFCDSIDVVNPMFDAPAPNPHPLAPGPPIVAGRTLRMTFRVGPGPEREIRPRKDLRELLAEQIPESNVWPWIYCAPNNPGGPPPTGMQFFHACETLPTSTAFLDAPASHMTIPARGGRRVDFLIYATTCPACRRIYWSFAAIK